MPAFRRSHVRVLLDRLRERPRSIQLIEGPRQTGKTTLVRQALQDCPIQHTYLSLDEWETEVSFGRDRGRYGPHIVAGPRDRRWLTEQWARVRDSADRSRDGWILALDEIQVIPGWSRTVKGLWDADRRDGRALHVVILGSAPLPIQRQLNESLAGRFEAIRVTQWSFGETREAFHQTLEEYLFYGGYPGAIALSKGEDRWRDFVLKTLVRTSIGRDVVSMTNVRKPALLQRLFRLGVAYAGQILSYSKVVGHLAQRGNVATVQKYLDLLEGAGLIAGLPAFSATRQHGRRSSPKLIPLDPAFVTADCGYSFSQALADRTFWGRIVESAVGAHLVKTATSRTNVSYWRRGSAEVDFVLKRGPESIAIEVKSGRQRRSTRGLATFCEKYSGARGLVVGTGGIPLDQFLTLPAEYWFDNP